MKDETAYFWSHINQGLIERKIYLEDSSDHGSTTEAIIVEIRLANGILIIGARDVVVTDHNKITSNFDMSTFEGTISNITDPKVLQNGRIVFHKWAGRDSIVIYPPTQK